MAIAESLLYCTEAQMERVLSGAGLTLRVDDDDDNINDAANVTWVREEATDWINSIIGFRYAAADMAANDYIQKIAAHKAACLASERRGNPVSASLLRTCEKFEEILELVRLRKREIPRLNESANRIPSLSNFLIDGRFRRSKVRVQEEISTGGSGTRQRRGASRELEFLED